MSTGAASRPRRPRRTGEEIRSRLISAAQEAFAEYGYGGASTKAIADAAEVAEVLIFRHFGNKAGLFDHAVLDPFERFVEDYAQLWALPPSDDPDIIARNYVERLYDFLKENRQLFIALLGARAHLEPTAAHLDSLFQRLESMVREHAVQFLPTRNPTTVVRLTFGLVFSAAIHDDILFPTGRSITRKQIINEIAHYVLHGIGETS